MGIRFCEVNRKGVSALHSNHLYSQPKLMNKATLFCQMGLVKLTELHIKTINLNGEQIYSFFLLP